MPKHPKKQNKPASETETNTKAEHAKAASIYVEHNNILESDATRSFRSFSVGPAPINGNSTLYLTTATSAAALRAGQTAAGVVFEKGDVSKRIGLEVDNMSAIQLGREVNIQQNYTEISPAGSITGVSNATLRKPEFSRGLDVGNLDFFGVSGQVQTRVDDIPKVKVILGAKAAAGVVTSRNFSGDIGNIAAQNGSTISYDAIPLSERRTNFGVKLGGMIGVEEGRIRPGAMLTVEGIAGTTGKISSSLKTSINAFKTIPLTKQQDEEGAMSLKVQAGLQKAQATITTDNMRTNMQTDGFVPNVGVGLSVNLGKRSKKTPGI